MVAMKVLEAFGRNPVQVQVLSLAPSKNLWSGDGTGIHTTLRK